MKKRSRKAGLVVLTWILCSALLAGCAAVSRQSTPDRGTSAKATGTDVRVGPGQMTREELHYALRGFADSFASTFAQATAGFARKVETVEARAIAIRSRVYTLASVFDIASSRYAGVALLDMVVLVKLNRLVWEEHYVAREFGSPALVMVDALKKLEADILKIAGKVMTPGQIMDLEDLITQWRLRYPEQIGVNFIRFSDFGDLGKKPRLASVAKPGGLFAEVGQAVQAAEDIRETVERAAYQVSRMQLIAGMQVELISTELLAQPEMRRLLSDITGFRTLGENLGQKIDTLPGQVSVEVDASLSRLMERITVERENTIGQFMDRFAAERQATIEQFMAEIADERRSTFNDILAEEKRLNITLAELQKTLAAGTALAAQLNTTIGAADALAGKFAPDPSAPPSKPLDIQEVSSVVEKAAAVTANLNQMVASVDQLLASPGWKETVPRAMAEVGGIRSDAERLVMRSFLLGAVLILLFFVLLLGYRVAVSRMDKRP